jgi:hypothetical protein
MKLPPTAALLPLIVLAAILGGCATGPVAAPPRPKMAQITPVVAPAPVAPAPVVPPPPKPPLAPEIASVVEHLTQAGDDTLSHDLVDTTGFAEALASLAPGAEAPKVERIDSRFQPPPRGLTADGDSTELIERDWTGLVLVPINAALSKAHTTAVRLLKVEAHPLLDGRVRIWIRLRNIASRQLPAEIACSFRMEEDTTLESPYFYEIEVPSLAYRDVFFVSPAGRLNTYTVLVRSKREDGTYSDR